MDDSFAKLRELLAHAFDGPEPFCALLDLMAKWPSEEEPELAMNYFLSHFLSEPSDAKWVSLWNLWRNAFGFPGNERFTPLWEQLERGEIPDWLQRQNKEQRELTLKTWRANKAAWERTQSQAHQHVVAKIFEYLETWPDALRFASRYKPGHPLWAVTRTLRILQIRGGYDPETCANIQRLVLRRDALLEIDCLQVLRKLPNIRALEYRLGGRTEVPILADFQNLEELDLGRCYALSHLNGLESLTRLKRLNLEFCESLKDLRAILSFPRLSYLNLTQCSNLPFAPAQPIMTTREEVAAFQQMFS